MPVAQVQYQIPYLESLETKAFWILRFFEFWIFINNLTFSFMLSDSCFCFIFLQSSEPIFGLLDILKCKISEY
jgi:hypothetical protein